MDDAADLEHRCGSSTPLPLQHSSSASSTSFPFESGTSANSSPNFSNSTSGGVANALSSAQHSADTQELMNPPRFAVHTTADSSFYDQSESQRPIDRPSPLHFRPNNFAHFASTSSSFLETSLSDHRSTSVPLISSSSSITESTTDKHTTITSTIVNIGTDVSVNVKNKNLVILLSFNSFLIANYFRKG